jgi:serine/threonine-protein kinase HipA
VLFVWWTGYGDAHLKNFGILRERSGRYRLSPAYDLVSTELYPRLESELSLPVDGKRSKVNPRAWRRFGVRCGLDRAAVSACASELLLGLPLALDLLERSALPPEMAATYRALLLRRSDELDAV